MNNSEHHPDFIDLVLKTMNRRHGLALITDQKVDTNYGKSEVFDLADKSMSTYIEVISGANVANRNKVVDRVNKLSKALINALRGSRHDMLHLIFENEIDQEERKYYANKFKSGNRIKYEFLDKKNILDFANAFKFSIPDFGDLKAGNVNELPPDNFEEEDVIDGMTLDERRESLESEREASTIGFFEDFDGNYWWLNAAEEFWPLGDAKMGNVYTYPKSGEKILRRNANAIKVGDFAIAYQKAPEQRLTSVYRVVESESEEILSFMLVHELTKRITWEGLLEIELFKESSIRRAKANGSFYPLSKELFIELIRKTSSFFHLSNDIDSLDRRKVSVIPTNLTRSEAISTDHSKLDSLGFTKDVQSLAALIALKDMKPPLAIALFGKWGSGKSFFMDSLEQRIRELSKYQGFIENEGDLSEVKEDEVFLSGIAHIKFNAWSYMDANLWAGLAHSLFEKLNLYITDNTKGNLERLKVQVKITKRLEILHGELGDHNEKKNQLEELKEKIQEERDHRILRYFSSRYDKTVIDFIEANGIYSDDAKKLLPSKLRGVVKKGISLVTYLKSNAYEVAIYTITPIVILLVGNRLVVDLWLNVGNPVWDWLSSFWGYFSLSVIPVIIMTITFLSSKWKILKSIKGLIEYEERIKSNEQLDGELKEIGEQTTELNELIREVESSIEEEYSSTSNLTQLAITNFITAKHDDDDYKKHLGIITTIRKDFETLSDLFSDQELEINGTLNEKEKQRIEDLNKDKTDIANAFDEKSKNSAKLERIVLYIDDLDRCTDEKVLQVLQAVHLLMAFPLFTVVVGVDERSVHNALKYRQLKRYQNIDKDLIGAYIKEIEPREYLEKIFQIPFQLPEATEDGVEQLINDIIPYPEYEPSNEMGEMEMGEEEYYKAIESSGTFKNEEKNIDLGPKTEGINGLTEKRESNVIKPEEIRINFKEKEYLQLFAPLVGNNPRTIKRYVNVFRIVKTHELDIFTDADSTLKIAFLIAFYTGKHRVVAVKFLKLDHGLKLNAYLSGKAGEAKEKSEEGKLLLLIESMQHKEIGVKEVLNMPKEDHLKLFNFIERFSYKLDSQIEKK